MVGIIRRLFGEAKVIVEAKGLSVIRFSIQVTREEDLAERYNAEQYYVPLVIYNGL